ncbi:hypothetical protein B0H16DRAFT_1693310 [Mycena metata]|uniref:Secreted protein n=1 Tax=Mycena metata TaxID=1033252 RepID=A0AAD7IIW6_9AGAR|nr:hypothetical protein B0H16DRAFT_1693310 [Mycena metata]
MTESPGPLIRTLLLLVCTACQNFERLMSGFTARLISVERNEIAPKNLQKEFTLGRDSSTAHNMADNISSHGCHTHQSRPRVESRARHWRALPAPKEKIHANFLFGFKCCKLEVVIGQNGADSKGLPFRHVLRDSIWAFQFFNILRGFQRHISMLLWRPSGASGPAIKGSARTVEKFADLGSSRTSLNPP